jgi:hypothetical protein
MIIKRLHRIIPLFHRILPTRALLRYMAADKTDKIALVSVVPLGFSFEVIAPSRPSILWYSVLRQRWKTVVADSCYPVFYVGLFSSCVYILCRRAATGYKWNILLLALLFLSVTGVAVVDFSIYLLDSSSQIVAERSVAAAIIVSASFMLSAQ